MFMKTLKSLAIAGTLVVGALASTSGAANAGGGHVNVSFGGPGFHFSIGDYGRGGWGHRRHRRPHYSRTCRPGKALRKARRMGLRRAHIVRVSRRGIVVAGRKWGGRTIVGFGKYRSCPVRFVRNR